MARWRAAVVSAAGGRPAGHVSAAAGVHGWRGGLVHLAFRVLQLLPHHGAVLQILAGVEPQGRALHRMSLRAGTGGNSAARCWGWCSWPSTSPRARAPARRPRCPTPVASARAAMRPACSRAAWSTRESISTTRRTWAKPAAACSCAAPVATARSCRANTWR